MEEFDFTEDIKTGEFKFSDVFAVTPKPEDVWEEIELPDIENLYGFIWKMCLKLMRGQNE